jgi:hypothetical protein
MDDKSNNMKDSAEIERMRLGKFEFKAMNNIFKCILTFYNANEYFLPSTAREHLSPNCFSNS